MREPTEIMKEMRSKDKDSFVYFLIGKLSVSDEYMHTHKPLTLMFSFDHFYYEFLEFEKEE